MANPGRFDGKVVAVTGAGSGIGQAVAVQLIGEGAKVAAIDVSAEGLAGTADAAGGSDALLTVEADLSRRDECHRAIGAAIDFGGRLDSLCNVAGVNRPGRLADVTQADWDFQFAVNVEGSFWTCQAAMPALLETDGSIVNTASNTAVQGMAYFAPYCATKGAVVAMTRALAMEFARTGVRINAVAPGGTATPLVDGVARDLPPDVDFDLVLRGSSLRGDAQPSEIAEVIVFVASAESRVIHGAIVHADLGLTTD